MAMRTLHSQELFSSPTSHARSLAPDDDEAAPTSEYQESIASSSALTLDSSSLEYETCSNDSEETTHVAGPGKLLGRLYDILGQKLEKAINRLAADKGPDAIADRLDTTLRRLLHENFLMRLSDLVSSNDASLVAMEALLGFDQPQRDSGRKGSNTSSKPDKRELENNVGLRIVQECGALLQVAIKFSDFPAMSA